jgi:predicted membrane-bound spermidine synthase
METFEELQPWGRTYYSIIEGSHICKKTDKAVIDIFTNPHFGRMVFIDKVLQSSEKDEKLYHSNIVEYAKPKGRVLIAGGAEGATAREVFLSPVLKEVVMVDWDDEFVFMMRKECFTQGSFNNPLLTLYIEDIMVYLSSGCGLFDCIIIDLLDPLSDDELKWLANVCIIAFTHLTAGSHLVLNAGGDFDKMSRLMSLLDEGCNCNSECKSIFIPSFQELWYLIRITREV